MSQPQAVPTSNIPYDPVDAAPPSPRLPPAHVDQNSSGLYDNPAYGASSPSLSASFRPPGAGFRNSEYDSVHGLNRDSTFGSGRGTPTGGYRDDPNASAVPMAELGSPRGGHFEEKRQLYADPRGKKKKRLRWLVIIALILLLIIIAVVLAVYFTVIRPNQDEDGRSEGSKNGDKNDNKDDNKDDNNNDKSSEPTWGGDGSEITFEDGTKYTYRNPNGGFWVWDPTNPLNNSAQCQDDTPPLSEPFRYGVDRMRGVNFGGWLNLEPFMSPALYEQFYPDAEDEWTLSEQLMARDGNLDAIENHYRTFITEEDFAMVAGHGLNWIRLPIPFWMIEKYPEEPYLERVSWAYFLKAIQWARKYGIRINLDLHAIPGSQNGWNHSGRLGTANWMNGAMGLANLQRSLDYIRILTQFISQDQYKDVVPFFGIINEPMVGPFPRAGLESFYAESYRMIRDIGGIGEGNGPWISIHEGFTGPVSWAGFLAGADRVAMDWHPYFAFTNPSAAPLETWATRPCTEWAATVSETSAGFGLIGAGEFSNAINDCGLYLNAVGVGTRYEGTFPGSTTVLGSCAEWLAWDTWTDERKAGMQSLMMASMDALHNYFFWNWKIGNSSATGKVETPFWSYRLAIENGWAPENARDADGQCERLGVPIPAPPPLAPWMTGGAGAGEVPTLDSYPWPPAHLSGYASYTPTGPIVVLPPPEYINPETNQPIDMGNGWANPADERLMSIADPTCTYTDPWTSEDLTGVPCAAAEPITGY